MVGAQRVDTTSSESKSDDEPPVPVGPLLSDSVSTYMSTYDGVPAGYCLVPVSVAAAIERMHAIPSVLFEAQSQQVHIDAGPLLCTADGTRMELDSAVSTDLGFPLRSVTNSIEPMQNTLIVETDSTPRVENDSTSCLQKDDSTPCVENDSTPSAQNTISTPCLQANDSTSCLENDYSISFLGGNGSSFFSTPVVDEPIASPPDLYEPTDAAIDSAPDTNEPTRAIVHSTPDLDGRVDASVDSTTVLADSTPGLNEPIHSIPVADVIVSTPDLDEPINSTPELEDNDSTPVVDANPSTSDADTIDSSPDLNEPVHAPHQGNRVVIELSGPDEEINDEMDASTLSQSEPRHHNFPVDDVIELSGPDDDSEGAASQQGLDTPDAESVSAMFEIQDDSDEESEYQSPYTATQHAMFAKAFKQEDTHVVSTTKLFNPRTRQLEKRDVTIGMMRGCLETGKESIGLVVFNAYFEVLSFSNRCESILVMSPMWFHILSGQGNSRGVPRYDYTSVKDWHRERYPDIFNLQFIVIPVEYEEELLIVCVHVPSETLYYVHDCDAGMKETCDVIIKFLGDESKAMDRRFIAGCWGTSWSVTVPIPPNENGLTACRNATHIILRKPIDEVIYDDDDLRRTIYFTILLDELPVECQVCKLCGEWNGVQSKCCMCEVCGEWVHHSCIPNQESEYDSLICPPCGGNERRLLKIRCGLRLFVNIEMNTGRNCNKRTSTSPCVCIGRCDPTECLNAHTMYQCYDDICAVKGDCGNRLFASMLRETSNPRNEIPGRVDVFFGQGLGLRATRRLPEGSFVGEYVGEITPDNKVPKHTNSNTYLMDLVPGFVIDARSVGNLTRFMNHSCRPNCAVQKWIVEKRWCIGIFTSVDVAEGDQLTFNYRLQLKRNHSPADKFKCQCDHCRPIPTK